MGARPWLILGALALARIAFGYQYQTVASLAPDLIVAYRLDYTRIGTLIGVFIAPGVLLALPLGLLGRRFGDGRVVGAGLALMTLGPLVTTVWTGPLGIGAARMLAGMGAVSMMVLQNKIISDWFSGRWFMVAISVSVAAYPIGVSAAQAVLPPLAHRSGVGTALLSDSVLVGMAGLLFLASYRTAPGAAPAPRFFSLPSRRECALVTIAGLIWTAYTGSYGGFVSYVPSLMQERGASDLLATAVMTIVTWGSVAATLAGAPLALRLGAFATVVLGSTAAALGCLGMALTSWPIASALLFGVVGSFPASPIMAAGTLSARPEHRAVGMGLFYTTYYAGNALVPALCGGAADAAGSPAGAIIAAGGIAALAIPVWFLHARLSTAPYAGARRTRC